MARNDDAPNNAIDGAYDSGRARAASRAKAIAKGRHILLCGPDGTGKSSLSTALSHGMGDQFAEVSVIHWRPGVLPRLGAVVGREEADFSKPHDAAAYGRTISFARLLYYWVDHVLGHVSIRRRTRRGGLVVMERGYWDFLVDPARYRIRRWPRLISLLGLFVPCADETFVLVGDPANIAGRKQELTAVEVERQISIWRTLGKLRGWAEISVDRPIDEIVAELNERIR